MEKCTKERLIKWGIALFAIMAVVTFRVITAYADTNIIPSFSVGNKESSPLSTLTNALFTVISAGADVYLVYGGYKWAESFDSDESKEQSKGISTLIAGALLANLKAAVDLFG